MRILLCVCASLGLSSHPAVGTGMVGATLAVQVCTVISGGHPWHEQTYRVLQGAGLGRNGDRYRS